jgi:ABC-type uncharacterized transport system permease subunit
MLYYFRNPKAVHVSKTIKFLGVVIMQAIGSLVFTFIASMIFQDAFNQTLQFMLMLGWTFALGIFLTGWLASRLGWLEVPVRFPVRAAATLFLVYLPLVAGFLLFGPLLPGSPFFGLSMLAGILGFHLPTLIKNR